MSEIVFHNVAEACELPHLPGISLQRYPRKIREQLNPNARHAGEDACGIEIRFRTLAPQVRLTLFSQMGNDSEVVFCRGAFEHARYRLPGGQFYTLVLTEPLAFKDQPPGQLAAGGFSPEVWRVCFSRCAIHFVHLDTFGHPLVELQEYDTPRLRWLAYGSSITHDWIDGHVFLAAKLLGVDVLNKGLAGGCHAEPEVADYLCSENWDFLTAEIGINMRLAYSVEQFEKQARLFLGKLRRAHPAKPIILISPYLNGFETGLADKDVKARLLGYRRVLKEIHAGANDPALHFIDGETILNQFSLLRSDLVHATTHGQALMGFNLANQLRPLVEKLAVRQ